MNSRPLVALLGLTFSLVTLIAAAQEKQAEPGPIPTQIAGAKRIFIANAGGDEPGFQDSLVDGGANRPYNQFYAAMKNAGRYELVGSPAEADVLFEIRFMVLPGPQDKFRESNWIPNYDPQFRLEIRDPRTTALLWAFTEHMEMAILQSNRNKNFDQAVGRIVADVQNLGTRAVANATAAKP